MRWLGPIALLTGVSLGCAVETSGLAPSDGPCEPQAEICDGLDNDCDLSTEDGSDDPALGAECDGPDTDRCLEGVTVCVDGALVCNDSSADSLEACGGGDEDCDGLVDEDGAEDAPSWFRDADGDFVGADLRRACVMPVGYVSVGGDCDDSRADVGPSSTERCDGVDNDCDGAVDEAGCSWPTFSDGTGSTYLLIGNASPSTWLDSAGAADTCGRFGYHLVRIDSMAENALLNERARTIVVQGWWIGLSDEAVEGTFVWQDGTDPAFTNFASMGGDPEDCVVLDARMGGGAWNARPCTEAHPFICETP